MKRIGIALILVLASASLFAQMPPMPPEVPARPPMPAQAPRPPQPPMPPNDPIERSLFPPDLIMNHQEDLHLSDAQRSALRKEVVALQTKVVDMQWQLSEEAEKLATMLRNTPVDEAKTLEQSDKVMSLEHDIKRLHLGTLIRIKNLLTPEQAAKLQEFRRRPQM